MKQLSIFDVLPDIPADAVPMRLVPKEEQQVLNDFGAKIGGARKDLWRGRGLQESDTADMNAAERKTYITKNNVWPKPDYRGLVESGVAKNVAYFIKMIRDASPCTPEAKGVNFYGEEMAQKFYIALLSGMKDICRNMKTWEDCGKIKNFLFEEGYLQKDGYRTVLQPKGYPGLSVKAGNLILRPSESSVEYRMQKAHFLEEKKETVNVAGKKKRYRPTPLTDIRGAGYDYRCGKNATSEMFMNDLGFRAGEYGNWLNQLERQQSLNHCYDSIRNLALVLGVPTKQLLCPEGAGGEPLAIAFGSRGVAYAAAHYEPLRHVINLTKMHGAGSLAHEMGHYLDNYVSIMCGGNEWSAVESLYFDSTDISRETRALVEAMRTRQLSHTETLDRLQAEILNSDKKLMDTVKMLGRNLSKDISRESWEDAMQKYFNACHENLDWKRNDWKIDAPSAELSELISLDPKGAGYWLKRNVRYLGSLRKNYVLSISAMNKAVSDPSYRLQGKSRFLEKAEKLEETWCKFGHGYWISNCEMFARAFACYVEDRLAERGIVDDYLTGHADQLGGTEGEERKKINQKIDEFLAAIKEKGFFEN